MKIIAFVGMPASGKSEASNVASDYDIDVIVMGDIIRNEIKKRGLEIADSNAGNIANELRLNEGMDAIAKRCAPIIDNLNKDIVVIDGIRGIAEVEYFKTIYGNNFKLISIEAPQEDRFKRIVDRNRNDDVNSLNELIRRDERELRWGMGQAMSVADIVIKNTSSLSEFKKEIRKTLS
ncbi:flagellar hook-basal body complex protein FliE [Methanosalsum natronophilum]|uniref:Flagellar hook-basal body complex protein FliE n=1 Tax=Methanosalsum natronophilum TaxID=768733 RepID=A0A424YV02_9EURY|nr:MAG: flagellar hook-basal body complex protein FliE [Methanosalsum natronophilum]